jgi:hypothetical protein
MNPAFQIHAAGFHYVFILEIISKIFHNRTYIYMFSIYYFKEKNNPVCYRMNFFFDYTVCGY